MKKLSHSYFLCLFFLLGLNSVYASNKYIELKSFLENEAMELELATKLCQKYGNELVITPFRYPRNYRLCENTEDILSARVCTGASNILLEMLKDSFPRLNFSQVWTHNTWPGGFLHVFIKVKDFFSKGEDLIIDPTYTQFIASDMNYLDIKDHLHKIFVGKYKDLLKIHRLYGKNYPHYYLNTRSWKNSSSSKEKKLLGEYSLKRNKLYSPLLISE